MLTKTALIGCLVSGSLGLPVAIPYAAGAAVAISVGPVELEASRQRGLDVDLNVECLNSGCPLAALRIGAVETPSYRVAI